MKEIVLGHVEALESKVKEVTIDGEHYFLTKNGEDYVLFSRICPHAGGEVMNLDQFFFCPFHMWRFNKENGECLNAACSLDSVPVVVRGGELVAVFS